MCTWIYFSKGVQVESSKNGHYMEKISLEVTQQEEWVLTSKENPFFSIALCS